MRHLDRIKKITLVKPDGSFYLFPDVSAFYGMKSSSGRIASSLDFCEHLLKEQLVACIPGSGFGNDTCIRLSYVASDSDLEEGMKRITAFCTSLTQRKPLLQ